METQQFQPIHEPSIKVKGLKAFAVSMIPFANFCVGFARFRAYMYTTPYYLWQKKAKPQPRQTPYKESVC